MDSERIKVKEGFFTNYEINISKKDSSKIFYSNKWDYPQSPDHLKIFDKNGSILVNYKITYPESIDNVGRKVLRNIQGNQKKYLEGAEKVRDSLKSEKIKLRKNEKEMRKNNLNAYRDSMNIEVQRVLDLL